MIVRPATPGDAAAMAALLNRIIAIGGTTAHQTPKTADAILTGYIDGPDCITAIAVSTSAIGNLCVTSGARFRRSERSSAAT